MKADTMAVVGEAVTTIKSRLADVAILGGRLWRDEGLQRPPQRLLTEFSGRTRGAAVQTAWPAIEKLDSPERTIESADHLRHTAALIGREGRVERVLEAARWLKADPTAQESAVRLNEVPHVTRRIAQVATLAAHGAEPAPVVVNQGSLRVASRVFGIPDPHRRQGSDGRLAVTRLLGGPGTPRRDTARVAMAAVLELAASMCTRVDPTCGECPLKSACRWHADRAAATH